MLITNYKWLDADKTYLVTNSIGETEVLRWRGYHYEEEWSCDVLIFFDAREFAVEWPPEEFISAIEVE